MVRRQMPNDYFGEANNSNMSFYALIALFGLLALVLGVVVIYKK